jgi:hypothetical protein
LSTPPPHEKRHDTGSGKPLAAAVPARKTSGMHTPEAYEALRWLADRGVTPLGSGRWQRADTSGSLESDNGDLAHEYAPAVVTDGRLSPMQRLRTGLGLLDLLDEYWVTAQLRGFILEQDAPELTDAFWAGYRRRLEAVEPCEQLSYSLWVDWFEDRDTVETAFSAVIGHDVRRLGAGPDLRALATGPLHRRTARVLECSGPVPWAGKLDVYQILAAVPELHPALFKGLLAGYHDVYGDLEPAAALTLLELLNLPPETEHLAGLRRVLRAGARNHHDDPARWAAQRNG